VSNNRAIAHNNVVFDTRFKKKDISKAIEKVLSQDTKVQDIFFNSITDYFILVIYILKNLKKTNQELNKILNDYKKLIDELKEKIPSVIYDQIILTNDVKKLNELKRFIKN